MAVSVAVDATEGTGLVSFPDNQISGRNHDAGEPSDTTDGTEGASLPANLSGHQYRNE